MSRVIRPVWDLNIVAVNSSNIMKSNSDIFAVV